MAVLILQFIHLDDSYFYTKKTFTSMKKIAWVAFILLNSFSASAQDIKKDSTSKVGLKEKIIFTLLFKPFQFSLPIDVFDVQKNVGNMKQFKSTSLSASTLAYCTTVKDDEYVINSKFSCNPKSYKKSIIVHVNGTQIECISAVDNNGKIKHKEYHLNFNNYYVFVVVSAELKTYNQAIKIVEKAVKSIQPK